MNIIDEKWDVLVILDACRYDMFEKVYGEFYPNEKCRIRTSSGTYTPEFLNAEFPNFYEDIVYISANPYVNSGMRVERKFRSWLSTEYNGFDAREHFPVIVDVWKKHDKETGSTLPKWVNKAFSKYYLKYKEKRFILHYMQPHRPYIACPHHITFGDGLKKRANFTRDTFSMAMNWKIKKALMMRPTSYEEEMYRDYGWGGLKIVYMNEIRYVLEHVKIITDALALRFVITSDHGERLGEHWWHMSHGPGPRHREVVEVPWLVVKNENLC